MSRRLSLYYYESCPFCRMVTHAIDQLGDRAPDIELRHVLREPRHSADLMAARGRGTVPVLRIQEDGRDEWMGESRDIVRYLRQQYGGDEGSGGQGGSTTGGGVLGGLFDAVR